MRGPANPASSHSCMLMSDMARKAPSDTSAINAMAGVRDGHAVPVIRGRDLGRKLLIRMPPNKQLTNSGS